MIPHVKIGRLIDERGFHDPIRGLRDINVVFESHNCKKKKKTSLRSTNFPKPVYLFIIENVVITTKI